MTNKQRRFCEEYIIDCNATQAAIRAGYAKNTAGRNADRMTKNEEVKKYNKRIDQLVAEIKKLTSEFYENIEAVKEHAKIEIEEQSAYSGIAQQVFEYCQVVEEIGISTAEEKSEKKPEAKVKKMRNEMSIKNKIAMKIMKLKETHK